MTTTRRIDLTGTILAVTVPLVVAALLVGIASLVRPQQPTQRVVEPVPTQRSLTCGFSGAPGQLITTGTEVTATTLTGEAVADPSREGAVRETLLLNQQGSRPLTAGVRSQSSAGLLWAECQPPATSGAVIIADPATAELLLVNPDRTDATVNISLSGATGGIQSPGLRGIVVASTSVVRVPISVHAPAGAPVTATYVASQGRVQASARTLTGGPEQVVASQPQPDSVFATMPAGSQVRLLLHNPEERRIDVTVELLGPRGRFAPPNGTASLAPNTTVTMDLTAALQDEPMGLVVTGTGPVLSMAQTAGSGDIAWILPQSPVTELTDAVPPGTLQIVNPSAGEAAVTLVQVAAGGAGGSSVTMRIPAGASGEFEVRAAGEVSIVSSVPVAAGVRLSGSGQAVTRLRASVKEGAVAPGVLDPQLGQRG